MQSFLCLMLVLWLENKTKIDHKTDEFNKSPKALFR